ncbi:MAG TPA: dihydropteroate synthase [Gammaproteobacteria bacterium]|nr:dihydropteroate synthase [Gammaproteobacteria bacterium]
MGVLNRTPDSFSDGGRYTAFDTALRHAETLVREGADILDVGGESTRPGAEAVGVQQELDRVIPLIERMGGLGVPVSVDTSKPEVMRAAVGAGAAMINDVYALRRPGALAAAAESGAGLCLMHMQGEPRSMQKDPQYRDVTAEVAAFLKERAEAAVAAGVTRDAIALDPGFGFGKNLEHNLTLLRRLPELGALGFPLLVGLSRKSMIGTLLGGKPVEERLQGSVAAAVIAVLHGAYIVRVHDVAATVDALKVTAAVRRGMIELRP